MLVLSTLEILNGKAPHVLQSDLKIGGAKRVYIDWARCTLVDNGALISP